MDATRTPNMKQTKDKPQIGGDKTLYIPKGTLLEFNLSQEQFWVQFDELVERFGCRGRGELMIRLAAGDLEIAIPPRKRRP